MNYNSIALCTLIVFQTTNAIGMNTSSEEKPFEYGQAMQDDIPALSALLDTASAEDQRRIIVLPTSIRVINLSKETAAKKIFVAYDKQSGKLVGYKKLFIIDDQEELRSTICKELQCSDDGQSYKQALQTALITMQPHGALAAALLSDQTLPPLKYSIFIYDGSDYTHPDFRKRGINAELTAYALKTIGQKTMSMVIQDHNIRSLCLVYGLVEDNSGDQFLAGRTSALVRLFAQEMASRYLGIKKSVINLMGARFSSAKPEFDATGAELPREKFVPGFGFVVAYALAQGAAHDA